MSTSEPAAQRRGGKRVLVYPRDSNPYQELLYEPLRRAGWRVEYLGIRLGERRLNLLALPILVVLARLRGIRLLHLHWVYPFDVSSGGRFHRSARLAQVLFSFLLQVLRLLRMRLVWTAHNILPHTPVFADDIAARRTLLRHAAAVIAHNKATPGELVRVLGPLPAGLPVRVIPLGPYPVHTDEQTRSRTRARLGYADADLVVVAFGAIKPYKGIPDLLTAYAAVLRQRPETRLRILIAGRVDRDLRAEVEGLVEAAGSGAQLLAGHIPDHEVDELFAAADVAAAPFRAVTTTSSVRLAISYGLPVVLPRLPALDDLPPASCRWHDPGVDGITGGLLELEDAPLEELRAAGQQGRAELSAVTWPDVAAETAAVYEQVLASR